MAPQGVPKMLACAYDYVCVCVCVCLCDYVMCYALLLQPVLISVKWATWQSMHATAKVASHWSKQNKDRGPSEIIASVKTSSTLTNIAGGAEPQIQKKQNII